MDSTQKENWNTKRRFIMAVICSALLLLAGSDRSALALSVKTPTAS
jgi:hypothetical protein